MLLDPHNCFFDIYMDAKEFQSKNALGVSRLFGVSDV